MSENILDVVKRSDKVAFMEAEDKFYRMKGFTSLGKAFNAQEHTRRYIDETRDRTDVVGISVSMGFAFEQVKGDPIAEALAEIIDKEKLGAQAVVSIVMVDFTKPITGQTGAYAAQKRNFAVIPANAGDDSGVYTYSGDFKTAGNTVDGIATSADEWETLTFAEGEGD